MSTWLTSLLGLMVAAGCGSSGTSGSAGNSPSPGGPCTSNTDCLPDELCQPHFYGCSFDNGGTCQPRMTECAEKENAEVCACDGQVYDDLCTAHASGHAVNTYGPSCTPPAGRFQCDTQFCDLATDYCEWWLEGPATCKPLPAACTKPDADCSCFGGTDALEPGCSCSEDVGTKRVLVDCMYGPGP